MINSRRARAFVEATILDPGHRKAFLYNPLVITKGTKPGCQAVVPKLPRARGVTVDIGFNGAILAPEAARRRTRLAEGRCTHGLAGLAVRQVSFCNGPNFFKAAFAMERAGTVVIPSVGISRKMVATAGALGTGRACRTVRNFYMVDQDPSDNVTTAYLLNPATGRTAQASTANKAHMPHAKMLVNGSDNALIDDFLDPALGCARMEAPDLGNHGVMTTSQALDELLAARNDSKNAALIPENDGMVVDNGGGIDLAKANLYRSEIGQPLVSSRTQVSSSPQMFCQNLINIQTPFIAANQDIFAAAPLAGAHGGRHSLHLPGEPAGRVVRRAQLPELRPDPAGHRHRHQ